MNTIRDTLAALLFYTASALLTVNYKAAEKIAALAVRVAPAYERANLQTILEDRP